MQKFTRLKRALDPNVRRWDRWCIPPLPAPFHPFACISSAPRDSKELDHTCRHNAQHKKAGQIIQSLYKGNHFLINANHSQSFFWESIARFSSCFLYWSRQSQYQPHRWTSLSLSCAYKILFKTHQNFHKQMKT
jgi:hypothetical protein